MHTDDASPQITTQKLRIGIDARTLTFSETAERGIGHYTVNHLSKLFELTPHWEYLLFLEGENKGPHIKRLREYANVKLQFFDEPFAKLDLYHIPDQMSLIPGFDSPMRLAPPNVPLSNVFYDLIPLVLREQRFNLWDGGQQTIYMKRLEQLKRSNSLILAISEHTRQDLHRLCEIPFARIVNISAGPNRSVNSSAPTEKFKADLLVKLGLKKPFFLSVGGLDLHKDFAITATAFIAGSKFAKMNLAVVGSSNDPFKNTFKSLFDHHKCEGVVFPGYLSEEELQALYASATALIFPSKYEGFGLPVLEAMGNGCPVITTGCSSIPEVVGDAAITVKPGEIEAIAQHMLRLIEDPSLGAELSRRGRIQAARFSWDRVVGRTIEAWQKLLKIEAQLQMESMQPQVERLWV